MCFEIHNIIDINIRRKEKHIHTVHSGSQPFALVGVPEQALGGFPWVWIDFGDSPVEVSCTSSKSKEQ